MPWYRLPHTDQKIWRPGSSHLELVPDEVAPLAAAASPKQPVKRAAPKPKAKEPEAEDQATSDASADSPWPASWSSLLPSRGEEPG